MRKLASVLLILLTLTGAISALAAGGGSGDPLITQSYITGTYMPDVLRQVGERVNQKTQPLYDSAYARLKAQAEAYLSRTGAAPGGSSAVAFTEQRFKRGDVVTVSSGSGILLLAGSAQLTFDSGAVVDVSAGKESPSGSALTKNTRYLAAENTLCRVTITSETAVLAPQGYYTAAPSDETDYNALSSALKEMGIFKGSDTGYGSGFDLERAPTRIEGLIMFLRLLGEESSALACTDAQPFSDVPDWAARYVAYAYKMGYTRGVGSEEMLFGTQNPLAAWEYLTFILRALGYRDSGEAPDFTWESAMEAAQRFGVITEGERALLSGGTFLRAHTAYLSYYALDAATASGGTLLSRLTQSGALNAQTVTRIRNAVTVTRIL